MHGGLGYAGSVVIKLMGEPATSHPSFWAPFVLVGDGGAP
jgi:CHAT domain-containing protein